VALDDAIAFRGDYRDAEDDRMLGSYFTENV
jgi:hypothetical protein